MTLTGNTSRPSPAPAVSAHSRRILVVDDDRDTRSCLERVLSDEGYQVETVVDGAEALASIARARPGLIVLDLMMPKLSGHDVLRELKKAVHPIPVVVITAAHNAHSSPGLPVLVKPLHLEDLLRAARTFLR
jgi:two-component system response regulator MprA